ncbi:antifungal protein ginkbilobin-like protein isoform X1 [Punica granatum]|uniref:Antifungal protein ginkbilobin-like protein isoform X1 n=1 Tax=Punica granatum TaxID=22663 RepID=A0A6P8C076_PUNGR|nr:antifungal protein ginkbilobin-like protein isoform X1 [Punica granatum]
MGMLVRAAAIIIGLLWCIFNGARCAPARRLDETLLSCICNGQQFSDEQWGKNRAYVLKQLVKVTPEVGFNYYVRSQASDHIVYGHAACNGERSKQYCQACLDFSVDQIRNQCSQKSIGAQVHLRDCRLRKTCARKELKAI